MRATWAGLSALLLSTSLLSCSLPNAATKGPYVQNVGQGGYYQYEVDPGGKKKDVYFVFTNPDPNSSTAADVSAKPVAVDGQPVAFAGAANLRPQQLLQPSRLVDRVAQFNLDARSWLRTPATSTPSRTVISTQTGDQDAPGQVRDFITDIDSSGNGTAQITATCRAVRSCVLADGKVRSLSVWSANSGGGLGVTNAMVDALAQRFLKGGTAVDDIYHWATDVGGEPWGNAASAPYMAWDPASTVTILLNDLNADYSGSVVVGYFWAKDNYRSSYLPGSNQRVMFYLDSTLLAKQLSSETIWKDTNFWPSLLCSTLGHEFQHMIQFYQKTVVHKLKTGADTWINEMCSQMMEDLLAKNLEVAGPRGVPANDGSAGAPGNLEGRVPEFNALMSRSLQGSAGYPVEDYSTSYAFGAWLLRNCGGAALLRSLIQSSGTDENAVVQAVTDVTGRVVTLPALLDQWAVAILSSNHSDLPVPYLLNSGDWMTSVLDQKSYEFGSLSFFNYNPAPVILEPTSRGVAATVPALANVYYHAAAGLTSPRTWQIDVPEGISFSVYVTEVEP